MGALLIVDMCNDFVTGKLRCDRAHRIIPNIRKLAASARDADMPVIYVNDAHLPEDFELRVWGPHAMRGTKAAETIPALRPEKKDVLRAHEVKEFVLTGLHTDICDRHTSADAFFRGYVPVIPEDGVEAMTEEDHRTGLAYLKAIYGAKVVDPEKVLKAWK